MTTTQTNIVTVSMDDMINALENKVGAVRGREDAVDICYTIECEEIEVLFYKNLSIVNFDGSYETDGKQIIYLEEEDGAGFHIGKDVERIEYDNFENEYSLIYPNGVIVRIMIY